MKRLFFISIFFLLMFSACGAEQRKLVVLIVLDQVPYDYVERFEPYFEEGGFRRLMNGGASFTNAQYPYAYTKTACGHAALVTGTTSRVNGIVGNYWYDREKGKRYGSVDDESARMVGGTGTGKSPVSLLVNSVGDMLLKQSPGSKVIGVSHKDRSAILMAGKNGSAYWIDDSVVVSSTYYMKELPLWVQSFNRSGAFQRYYGAVWDELLPDVARELCDDDDAPYEAGYEGLGRTFPQRIVGRDSSRITPSYYRALASTPFSAELMFSLAREATLNESLGMRGVTDMLCVSISAIDYVGHEYGPNSHEYFDMLLRTDRMLAEFFTFLDQQIGREHLLVALSADHGIAPIPEYKVKTEPEIRAVRISSSEIKSRAERMLTGSFGKASTPWLSSVVDGHLYLNEGAASEKGIPMDLVRKTLKDSLTDNFPIDKAYTYEELQSETDENCFCAQVRNSFYPSRSGDVLVLVHPFSIIDSSPSGTNHGMPYRYDSHVPLMIAGAGIKPGTYHGAVEIIDLAPTLATLLGIPAPDECEGRVLREIFLP